MAERGDIDRVRESTDLVDLISEVTKVKRSGRSFMAVCPFHEEKTPSMSVDRARGLYHCFGCGKGGDVFSFVQETQGVDFADALELLARRAGVTLVRDPADARQRGRRAEAVEALKRAIEVYHDRLKKAPEAGPARAYLRQRGYDVGIIDEWNLGFAATDWDTLTKELKAGGLDDQVLIDAGLSRRGRHGLFDVFRGRLMFPIHDLRGDAVGFGGRKVDDIDRNATNNADAKYVNSADSVVYHKAHVLFGLDRARREISDDHPAVIVEGYTDVIAMHQAGIKTAVATCGTALGDGHFDLLRRFSEAIVLSFDPDEAGSRAAVRGDELQSSSFRSHVDLLYAGMPDHLDPADLVQFGRADEVRTAIDSAVPLLEHRIRYEVSQQKLESPGGRDRALTAAAAHIAKVDKATNPLARDQYVSLLARLIGPVERDVIEAAIDGVRIPTDQVAAFNQPLPRIESELMRVLIADPSSVEGVVAEDFTDQRLRQAFSALDLSGISPGQPVDISEAGEEETRSLLRSLAMDDRPLPSGPEILTRVKERRLDVEIEDLQRTLAGMEPGSDAHSDNLRRLIALQQEKRSSTRM